MQLLGLDVRRFGEEVILTVRGSAENAKEFELFGSLVQNLRGSTSLRQLLAILDEREERTEPTIVVGLQIPGSPVWHRMAVQPGIKVSTALEFAPPGEIPIPVHIPIEVVVTLQ
jgi:hypothetical protein